MINDAARYFSLSVVTYIYISQYLVAYLSYGSYKSFKYII